MTKNSNYTKQMQSMRNWRGDGRPLRLKTQTRTKSEGSLNSMVSKKIQEHKQAKRDLKIKKRKKDNHLFRIKKPGKSVIKVRKSKNAKFPKKAKKYSFPSFFMTTQAHHRAKRQRTKSSACDRYVPSYHS